MHISKRRRGEDGLRGPSASHVHLQSSSFDSEMDGVHKSSKNILGSTLPDDLTRIGIIELLDQDLRPTFIIELDSISHQNEPLRPVYVNPFLYTSRRLQWLVLGKTLDPINADESDDKIENAYKEFVSWVFQPAAAQARNASLNSIVFNGICWMTSTLRDRWRVVYGNNYKLLEEDEANAHTPAFLGNRRVSIPRTYVDNGLEVAGLVRLRDRQFGSQACWKTTDENPFISTHLQLVQGVDWSSTSLGAIDTWSPEVANLCNIAMAEEMPTILFLGEENTLLYNEAYVELLGEKHPSAMGSSAEATFPEIWCHLRAMLEPAKISAKPIRVYNHQFLLDRKGFVEETYFDSTFLPLVAEGSVVGFHESVLETTKQVLSKRRSEMLVLLDERTSPIQTLQEFWKEVAFVVEQVPDDMPFTICYSANYDPFDPNPRLYMATGLRPNFTTSEEGQRDLDKLLKLSLHSVERGHQLLIIKDVGLSKFTDPIDVGTVIVSCTPCTTVPEDAALLVIGLSSRLAADAEYAPFIDSFLSKLNAAFLVTSTREKEARERKEEQERMRVEKEHLSKELRLSETKFERLAESAPVGIWVLGVDGKFIFRNKAWFNIMRHPSANNTNTPYSWTNLIHEDHQMELINIRNKIHRRRNTLPFKLKLKRLWDQPRGFETAREAIAQNAWILGSSHPNEYFQDGRIKSFVGCVMEISELKWAEDEQARRKEEALKAKKHQEAFVDMVSHEIRNPLAAIVQSADSIIVALESSDDPDTVHDDLVESAQVIITCAQHQKRIVDDILSMSKLDADLLEITPAIANPIIIAQQALGMLKSEAKNADISTSLSPEPSYTQLGVNQVYLDPSRLTQVLINLLTNAIKFTRLRPAREINIRIGASLTRPSLKQSSDHVTYISANSPCEDFVAGSDWGTGEKLFITFSVQDTGRGLSDEEKKVLFQRFSQANRKTHVDYGGSGLGLFISRTLVEKQGGEIGVASESGVGSIFAFFIMVRRVEGLDSTLLREPSNGTSNHASKQNQPHQNQNGNLNSKPLKRNSSKKSATPIEPLNLHILITEDNLINQTVLKKQLLPYGCHISLANHGLEALDFLSTSIYSRGKSETGIKLDVILMDHEMPIMDGLTCVKRIRELERVGGLVGHVPVVAVTANARKGQVDVLLGAGCDGVVAKPFRVGELVDVVRGVVGRVRGSGELNGVSGWVGRERNGDG